MQSIVSILRKRFCLQTNHPDNIWINLQCRYRIFIFKIKLGPYSSDIIIDISVYTALKMCIYHRFGTQNYYYCIDLVLMINSRAMCSLHVCMLKRLFYASNYN